MRIDIRDSKYSIIYNEKTGTVEDVLWCNESAEDLKNLNVVADMARELAVYRQAGTAMIAGRSASHTVVARRNTLFLYRVRNTGICTPLTALTLLPCSCRRVLSLWVKWMPCASARPRLPPPTCTAP